MKGSQLKRIIGILAGGLLACAVQAAECGNGKTFDIFDAKSHGGYVFRVYRPSVDITFLTPGQTLSLDKESESAVAAFRLDGTYYQIIFARVNEFSSSQEKLSASALLDAHAKWEYEHAVKVGSPLKIFKDSGNAVRPAASGTPELTFKLWSLSGTQAEQEFSQHFLTTVIGDEIAEISGVFRGKGDQFRDMARAIASTMGYLSPKHCGK